MTDALLIADKIAEVAATADLYPGVVIVLNVRTQAVEYMSERGCRLLQTNLAELRAMGPAYHERFFNPAEAPEYLDRIWALLENNDFDSLITLFQQVRTTESPDWSWYFTTMRLLLGGTDGRPLLLLCFACPLDPHSHAIHKVQRLLDENNFLRRHAPTFGTLTGREREVLRRLALGHSAPAIGEALFVSKQTVETHRRNLRRKLGVESAFELGQYARAFDLI